MARNRFPKRQGYAPAYQQRSYRSQPNRYRVKSEDNESNFVLTQPHFGKKHIRSPRELVSGDEVLKISANGQSQVIITIVGEPFEERGTWKLEFMYPGGNRDILYLSDYGVVSLGGFWHRTNHLLRIK